MITRIYRCDKCGEVIDGVVYSITCYAEDTMKDSFSGISKEAALQNMKQNLHIEERHLCKSCKDAITDGVFVV